MWGKEWQPSQRDWCLHLALGQVERFAWRSPDRRGPCRLRGSLGKGHRGEHRLLEGVKASRSRRLEIMRCVGQLGKLGKLRPNTVADHPPYGAWTWFCNWWGSSVWATGLARSALLRYGFWHIVQLEPTLKRGTGWHESLVYSLQIHTSLKHVYACVWAASVWFLSHIIQSLLKPGRRISTKECNDLNLGWVI